MTRVVVTDDDVGLSTVAIAVVVVDSDDPIEDVREVELVDEVDDVSVLVEDVMAADVDVTLVDTTSVGVVDVELAEVGESSEVLDKEITGDVEAVVAVGVANVVSVVEDSADVADELEVVIVCDSGAVGAAEVDVDSEAESEIKADVEEELITVELSIC
ncbi:MAG: hypothetical protein ABSA50_12625 [Candidatus Bathyarchaeia archaeon]